MAVLFLWSLPGYRCLTILGPSMSHQHTIWCEGVTSVPLDPHHTGATSDPQSLKHALPFGGCAAATGPGNVTCAGIGTGSRQTVWHAGLPQGASSRSTLDWMVGCRTRKIQRKVHTAPRGRCDRWNDSRPVCCQNDSVSLPVVTGSEYRYRYRAPQMRH